MSQGSSPVLPEVHSSLAVIFLSGCIGFILYGLILQQAYYYFRTFPGDHWLLKSTAWLLLIMETVHYGFGVDIGYEYLISNYNYVSAFERGNVAIALLAPVVGAVVIASDCFYARRVYLFLDPSHRLYFVVGWATIVCTAIGSTMVTTTKLLIDTSFANWLRVKWLVTVSFACIGASDVVVAVVLIIHLYRKRTGYKRTDRLLDSLIAYAFNTGLVTSLSSFCCMVLSILEGRNLYVIGFSMMATKVYANSVFITMNSRQRLRSQQYMTTADTNVGAPGVHGTSALQFRRSQVTAQTIV